MKTVKFFSKNIKGEKVQLKNSYSNISNHNELSHVMFVNFSKEEIDSLDFEDFSELFNQPTAKIESQYTIMEF